MKQELTFDYKDLLTEECFEENFPINKPRSIKINKFNFDF